MIVGGLVAEAPALPKPIDTMTIDELRFWWNCVAAYRKRCKEEAG